MVHLKRFSYSRASRDKLTAAVDFQLQGLDLAPYMLRGQVGCRALRRAMHVALLQMIQPACIVGSACACLQRETPPARIAPSMPLCFLTPLCTATEILADNCTVLQ